MKDHLILTGGLVNILTAREFRFTGSISANQEVREPILAFPQPAIRSLAIRIRVEPTVQMATASKPKSGRPKRRLAVKRMRLGLRRAVTSLN